MADCTNFIQEFFDYASQHKNSYNNVVVNFNLVSNQSDGRVSYAEGTLSYQPAVSRPPILISPQFTGSATGYYFNDRRQRCQLQQDGSCQSTGITNDPFSNAVGAVDSLEVSISINTFTNQLQVILTTEYGQIIFNPDCVVGDMLSGVATGIGANTQALYVISLHNIRTIPIP